MQVNALTFSQISKTAFSLALIGSALAVTAPAAEAGSIGSFQVGNFATKLNLSQDSIDFQNPFFGNTAEIEVTTATGDFQNYQSAFIQDLFANGDSILNAIETPIYSFFDFSAGQVFPFGAMNVADNMMTFDLMSSTGLMVEQADPGVLSMAVEFDGYFRNELNETSFGRGNLTFQIAESGITVNAFQTRLDAGEVFSGLTFSGAMFTAEEQESSDPSDPEDVLEPANLWGLLAITVGAIALRRTRYLHKN